MSKKRETFPSRPPAPTIKEIEHDLTTTELDDIAFRLFRKIKADTSTETSNLMAESFLLQDGTDDLQNGFNKSSPFTSSSSEDNTTDQSKNIDVLYKQAVQFLETSDKLKDAPESLKLKYNELSKLGIELKESIEVLKKQSHDVLNNSISNDSVDDLK